MQGARKDATGAYMEIREDRVFVGNTADGSFLEVSFKNPGVNFK